MLNCPKYERLCAKWEIEAQKGGGVDQNGRWVAKKMTGIAQNEKNVGKYKVRYTFSLKTKDFFYNKYKTT